MTTAALVNIMLFESWMTRPMRVRSVGFATIYAWVNAERSALGS